MGFLKSLVDKVKDKKEELERDAAKRAAKKVAEIAVDKGSKAARAAWDGAGKSIEKAIFGDVETQTAAEEEATRAAAAARLAKEREAKERAEAHKAKERAEADLAARNKLEKDVNDELAALKKKLRR